MNVDELRRCIESMPPAEYERASYDEQWLADLETLLGRGLSFGGGRTLRVSPRA